jgi:putative phosphoribosyl transferase
MPFINRMDAGRQLAQLLLSLRGEDVVVLGLPRGGVPVAFEVAHAVGAPLDVITVRKLGVPFQPELAMGAIGEGGVRVINEPVMRMASVSEKELAAVEERERAELERRARRFRGDRPRIPLSGRTVVIVDDGIATGSTARAACRVARAQGASHVVLAIPVAPPHSVAELRDVADEVVCVETTEWFFAIGQFYADFSQVSDDEVVALLDRAAAGFAPAPAPVGAEVGDPPGRDEEVTVPVGPVSLAGHLTLPQQPKGLVVFAHGSGSSRHSPRNRFVASVLNEAGLGTLLFDLLTPAEEMQRAKVFDIELLAQRLVEVTRWARRQPGVADLRIGYFGASTGAGAALWAAADPGADVDAVVSRGGRPDLAAPRLAAVSAATLLIVGGHDEAVLELNRLALAQLQCECRLAVVPGATHLFAEPGTLEEVARLAREWFVDHLVTTPVGHPSNAGAGWLA